MSYQVIARKYRPQRFSEVVSQDHVTRTLARAIEQNRIAHAYLFSGPRGTGKTTLARIVAKCLNCEGGPRVDFKDEDPRCREIAEGRALDVIEIDGASNRGIEEIRELRETVRYSPAVAQFKVYIIDEVHMLTKEAFNALLKTLEEPPAHAKFLFATTEPEKVLPTILSRCQRFDLRRIPAALIAEHLGAIAKKEQVTIEKAALEAIARGAEGGMRDAESSLDQLISFCGSRIVESDVLSMFGLASRQQILSWAREILEGSRSGAIRRLDDLLMGGKELARLLCDLQQFFRDLMLFKISEGDAALLDLAETEAAQLQSSAHNVSSTAIARILDVLSQCEARLRETAGKRIAVELALVRAIEARHAVPIEDLIRRLEGIRNVSPGARDTERPARQPELNPPVSRASTDPPVRHDADAPSTRMASREPAPRVADQGTLAPAAKDDGADPVDLEVFWKRLLSAVGKSSPFARSYLAEGAPLRLEGKTLTIGFGPESHDHLELLDHPKNRQLVLRCLGEIGFSGWTVQFKKREHPIELPLLNRPEVSLEPGGKAGAERSGKGSRSAEPEQSSGNPSSKATKPAGADLQDDPLIQEALELFKGHIVKVKNAADNHLKN